MMWPLYILALGTFVLAGGILLIFRTFVKKVNYVLLVKIISVISVAVFFVRFMSFRELQLMPSYESG